MPKKVLPNNYYGYFVTCISISTFPTAPPSISTGRVVVPPRVPAPRWCGGASSASPSRPTAATGDFRGSLGLGEEGGRPHSAAWKRRLQQQAARRSNGNASYTGRAGFMLCVCVCCACLLGVTNPSSPSSMDLRGSGFILGRSSGEPWVGRRLSKSAMPG